MGAALALGPLGGGQTVRQPVVMDPTLRMDLRSGLNRVACLSKMPPRTRSRARRRNSVLFCSLSFLGKVPHLPVGPVWQQSHRRYWSLWRSRKRAR